MIVAGAALLAYGGFTTTKKENVIDIGQPKVEAEVQERHSVPAGAFVGLAGRRSGCPGAGFEEEMTGGSARTTGVAFHAVERVSVQFMKHDKCDQKKLTIRERGGAIFGDRRFGRVFIYHSGAEACQAARGFRGMLDV
jgi:hypothetical protein